MLGLLTVSCVRAIGSTRAVFPVRPVERSEVWNKSSGGQLI
jgi:hypothetical protein